MRWPRSSSQWVVVALLLGAVACSGVATGEDDDRVGRGGGRAAAGAAGTSGAANAGAGGTGGATSDAGSADAGAEAGLAGSAGFPPRLPDVTPPDFEGARSAEPAGAFSVRVAWQEARDDVSPAAAIRYRVLWASSPGVAVTTSPALVTTAGTTSVVVDDLPVHGATYYFVVRAEDEAGNADGNAVEVSSTTGPDVAPPTFEGCGAIESVGRDAIGVSWSAAIDDVSTPADITYRLYVVEGSVSAGDPLGTPREVVGATTGDATGLTASTTYSLVCRAVDESGNEDDNFVIVTVTTLEGVPPTFGGLETVEATGTSTVTLRWSAGQDDVTAAGDLRYAVYQATSPRGQDFSQPVFVTNPGATEADLTGLDSNTRYFWVVRAIDEALNDDGNSIEVTGRTLVSFVQDVQPIFTAKCASQNCHDQQDPPYGLVLEEGFSYVMLVDVPALGSTGKILVDSTSSNPLDSLLYRKVSNTPEIGDSGTPMPPFISPQLTDAEIAAIYEWIALGSERN